MILTALFILITLSSIVNAISGVSPELNSAYVDLVHYFDEKYPPVGNKTKYKTVQIHHSKRCIIQTPYDAIEVYKKNLLMLPVSGKRDVFVMTPCLGSDSLGNVLGGYFEGVMCAQFSGLHYFALSKVWEPDNADVPSPFLDKLPSIIEHKKPIADFEQSQRLLARYCRCHGSCHERPESAWIHGISTIKRLILFALEHHLSVANPSQYQNTIVTSTDKSTSPVGTILPFIPDAAIHYRCGDNFVGHYGFLPFEAFTKYVPSTARQIYILAEKRSRKTIMKSHLAEKCDVILDKLFSFLVKTFPSSQIVLRRGDDLYADFARLSYAGVTVCSVSTFCLWPAVVSNGTAYFPKTKLLLAGDTSINLGFKWIEHPSVVIGSHFEFSPISALLAKLGARVSLTEGIAGSNNSSFRRSQQRGERMVGARNKHRQNPYPMVKVP